MTQVTDNWTAEWMVEAWGLRAFGALTTPWKLSTGGKAVSDDESQAAWYVEQTPGFGRAKEVLIWRYQRFGSFAEFPIRRPGETIIHALLRRGWGDMLGWRADRVAQSIHDEFMVSLMSRLVSQPFRPMRPLEDEDADELATVQNLRFPVGRT